MKTARQRYQDRMERVLDHVDRHLDGDLDLATLAGVAAFSPCHFHRQFSAVFEVSVHRYVQLARMKRASYRLAFRDRDSVTAIAMEAGYDAPDAFARAFRKRIGQLPSAFRRSPDWETWHAALGPLTEARSKRMQTSFSADQVTIRDTPPVPVAVMEHRGDPRTIGATIQRFIAWRKAQGLGPRVSTTWNIFHSDPRTAAPEDYRLSLCAGTDRPVAPNEAGVAPGLIPGGRCAVLPVTGSSDDLEPAALFLYRDWLPASGEEPRDFPLYCRRIAFFPDVPEHEAVTELYLPLK
ncbi:helix-turn-helix domain-containing protein [Sphingomonas parva]|uniref:Helix-turn-helix domain-containing protein n=1 Tax=Sphingomonas parva TaxID=2555898 RepID=A0A4Y8ZRB9_9SPHN|nr:AraC family transcriptional regulator [Sphingomonas parva]TFI56946.1 helix-turn-helix domain-containing protein [Sphingomonas parva]